MFLEKGARSEDTCVIKISLLGCVFPSSVHFLSQLGGKQQVTIGLAFSFLEECISESTGVSTGAALPLARSWARATTHHHSVNL